MTSDSKVTRCFATSPTKGSSWGHALSPKNPAALAQKMDAFFAKYFERTDPPPGPFTDGSLELDCKVSSLPNIDWPAQFANSPDPASRRALVMLLAGRISFPAGLLIPISQTEESSYNFLRHFSADAPFKMTAKHFGLVIPIGKQGNCKLRRADPETLLRLSEVIG